MWPLPLYLYLKIRDTMNEKTCTWVYFPKHLGLSMILWATSNWSKISILILRAFYLLYRKSENFKNPRLKKQSENKLINFTKKISYFSMFFRKNLLLHILNWSFLKFFDPLCLVGHWRLPTNHKRPVLTKLDTGQEFPSNRFLENCN